MENPKTYCATVGAIESANTVGYLSNELAAGVTPSGVPFQTTTAGNIALNDIVPQIGGTMADDATFSLRYYDRAKGGYYILDWYKGLYDSEWNLTGTSGWGEAYQVKAECASKTFNPGEGFLIVPVDGLSGTPSIPVCGQLVATDNTKAKTEVVVPAGVSSVGNPLPAQVELYDIIPLIGDAIAEDATFSLRYYDRAKGGYYILDWYKGLYDSEWNLTGASGWGEAYQEKAECKDKVFAPGEGFLIAPVDGLSGTTKLTFPNPMWDGTL